MADGDVQVLPPGRQAAPVVARSGSRITRHLMLVNQPGWQDVNDLQAIAAKVRWLDPTIGTFVVPWTVDNVIALSAAAALPTLVVSFGPLGMVKPLRGKVYHGRIIPKFEQLRRLAAAGVPVPRTAVLRPDTVLDPAVWGEFVVLKPTDIFSSSHGRGIQLMRTRRVRYLAPEEYPEDHPGRKAPMLVQQYIDTGGPIVGFRVLTFFGEPMYCIRNETSARRPDLGESDEVIEASNIALQTLGQDNRTRTFMHDADAIEVARAANRAIPEAPLQGCDVMRDARTGRVYVLELNPGGNTWHFSSDFNAEARAKEAPSQTLARYGQFDAFSSAAHILVARTRTEAE